MKTYMPLDGLKWCRDSGSAHCDMPQNAVLGRPGGGVEIMGCDGIAAHGTKEKRELYTCLPMPPSLLNKAEHGFSILSKNHTDHFHCKQKPS